MDTANNHINSDKTTLEAKPSFNLIKIFWYFIILSIIGLIIETFFCYATTGILESRKGLLLGPFCPIYGVGGTILIVLLEKYKNSYIKLFIYGSILGDAIEYILSFILEAMYGNRFWEYSYINLNLNGRICITYTIFWGILSIILIKSIKPFIDNIILKIHKKTKNFKIKNIVEILLLTFLIIDCILTIWGVSIYTNRATDTYYNKNIDVKYKNSLIVNFEEMLFSNEYMKKTFPNLRFINNYGDEIFVRDIL